MENMSVYLEIGKRKTFASALAWPGWSRSGKIEEDALTALVAYAPRYAWVMAGAGLDTPQPKSSAELDIVAQLEGSATTDFGAPGAIPEADQTPLDQQTFERFSAILDASWQAFENALAKSEGIALRKGPRGGGRDQAKMAEHVIESHRNYLKKLGWQSSSVSSLNVEAQLKAIRQQTTGSLTAALNGELPEAGPRGSKLWPARYFVRRAAWHILDHAWEIEDRMESSSMKG